MRGWLMLAAVWCLAALGLRGGDPVASDALWSYAGTHAQRDLTDPVYADAARELARVRPWQPGYATARERLGKIQQARLRAVNDLAL